MPKSNTHEWYHDLTDQAPHPCTVRGAGDEIVYLNPAFTRTYGYDLNDIPTVTDWYEKAYPDSTYKTQVLEKWTKLLDQLDESNIGQLSLEVNIRCKNGSTKQALLYPFLLKQRDKYRYGVNLIDISDLRKTENIIRENQQRLTLAIEHSGAHIWDWNLASNQVFYSTALLDELGYDSQTLDLSIESFFQILHPDEHAMVRNAMQDHLENDSPYHLHYRLKDHKGVYQLYESTGKALRNKDGKPYRFIGTHKNITQRQALNDQAAFGKLVFENSGEAILIADKSKKIKAVNPAFCLISGYEKNEVQDHICSFLLEENPLDERQKSIIESVDKNGHWSGETWYKRKSGEPIAIDLMINTTLEEQGGIKHYIILFSDITDKKNTQELIWQQAHYDNLTKLLNRHSFTQYLNNTIKQELPFALLFIDLDHFKQVNDTQGHNVGDELLCEAAKRIKHCVRASDVVARFGGDEFTVVLTGIKNVLSIKRICNDITLRLSEPYILNDDKSYISASIGIAQYPWDSDNVDDLYKFADQAMYESKHKGRNRYSFFTHELQEKANEHRKISLDLRQALENHQFQIFYQPIVDLNTQKVYKAEALIRWLHPSKGLISPADFIPIAEESGLIIEIGNWVFKQAAMQAKIWRRCIDPNFQISINKSPVQFYNEKQSPKQLWGQFLHTINLPGNGISVEITEGLLLDSAPHITERINQFHESGMQISIDDFGTGYSALSYLKKFAIDYIKIDKSFISNIENDEYDIVLCETIISMAHKLGMKVIAEGVETEQQKQRLLKAKCDYAQGYLFSRPLAAEEITKLLT
ncbi:EAL domain-containing protein [Bermanella sp. R86510]|uniref:sensor domain-containing protein n=1 Tax=unclassified Bermanella TaxID=2627862 RepID=UPI0037CB66F3